VGIGTVSIGVSTAWLVTLCEFPGRRFFEPLLLLPLAAPAYILAYTYTDLLEYSGPIQSQLRSWFGWESAQDYWFPSVRSIGGAIVMLTLVLYPYVYLLARSAFLTQSSRLLEASRNLGCSPWQSFWQVALPLARPAIVAGVSLALMETLNDFGTVEFFSVPTFTTGIAVGNIAGAVYFWIDCIGANFPPAATLLPKCWAGTGGVSLSAVWVAEGTSDR
jgi:iron(III) transport system permease protein